MVDQRPRGGGGDVAAGEAGQEADAVLPGVGARGLARVLGGRGEEVKDTDGGIAGAARGHNPRPTGKERHAVATVPDIGLVAAVGVAGTVAVVLLEVVALGRATGATVVGREDHQRVLGDALGVERVEDLADAGIGLDAEVAVGADATGTQEFRGRSDGRVRAGEGETEEEGSLTVLSSRVDCSDSARPSLCVSARSRC